MVRERMEDNRREFLSILCGIYMTFILAIQPLYTGGSYYKIGDNKYFMFRNVSLFCLGLWLIIEIVYGIAGLLRGIRVKKSSEMWIKSLCSLSAVDYFMLAYAAVNVLSVCLSRYKNTAFFGYNEWYMGALSQLIFVGIYFFVSRRYDGKAYPVYAGEAALLIVVVLGFVNKLGIDPLGMYVGYSENDWEYSHMLSTVGNINWLCSYISSTIPLCIAGFLYCSYDSDKGDRKQKEIAMFALSALALAFLFMHGSDAGLIITPVCIIFCMAIGMMPEYRPRFSLFFEKGLLLAGTVMLIVAVTGTVIVFRKHIKTTPNDSVMQGLLGNPIWWIMAAFFFVIYLIYRKCRRKARYRLRAVFFIMLIILGMILAMTYILKLFSEDTATGETGRAAIWRAALEGFCHAPFLQKIIGAGPDCFAEYIYSLTDINLPEVTEGFWRGVIFANAHNEWLNQLINIGIVGVVTYAGIFVSAAKRYRGMLAGLLVIALYFLNSLVSFQQVMNAPILFLLFGLFESVRRKANTDLTAK